MPRGSWPFTVTDSRKRGYDCPEAMGVNRFKKIFFFVLI